MRVRNFHTFLSASRPLRMQSSFRSFGSSSSSSSTSSTALPDFNDSKRAYSAHSTYQLFRALFIYRLCASKTLVRNSETLLRTGRRVFGDRLVDWVLHKTFFAHFCAGVDQGEIKPRIAFLQKHGIGGILDYAAEGDVEPTPVSPVPVASALPSTAAVAAAANLGGESSSSTSGGDHATPSDFEVHRKPPPASGIQARVYEYKNERLCDANMEIFLRCIRAVHNVTPEGFAAIKLTALGNPILLERMSTALIEIGKLFKKFDVENKGVLDRATFEHGYRQYFAEKPKSEIDLLFKRFDADGSGGIDYIEWSKTLRLEDLHQLTANCKEHGPLYRATLDEEERKLISQMHTRLTTLVEEAKRLNVRIMIDAEQSYFQPAIDSLVIDLQKKHNREEAIVFTTYQAYLRDSYERLVVDLKRAENDGFWFAAKVVRGAYMVLERARAQRLNIPDPIQPSLEDTHANYHRCIETVLRAKKEGKPKACLLAASHNQKSIEHTLALMHELGIQRGDGVYFGQLLGMADHLTFSLGSSGYKAYKYVPYGPVKEVVPYLIRRAQENSDVLGGVTRERAMIRAELRRRLFGRERPAQRST